MFGEIQLYYYRLPLARPLRLKSPLITEREGLLIRLTDQLGHVGWGEIAPLPGFSVESLDQARESAIKALRELASRDLPEPQALLGQGIGSRLESRLPPSVSCGIEMAILNLWSHHRAVELRHLLSSSAPDSITVNGLLSGSEEQIIESSQQMIADGYETLKLKIGAESLESEIDKVRSLRAVLPSHTKFRLDANRAWNFDTAVTFGKSVSDLGIEYIEEPLSDHRALEQFHSQTGIPYALDESLVSMTPEQLTRKKGLAAIILKPTILGGVSRAWQFAERAKELGLLPVVSSSFESSIGLIALTNLASAIAPEVTCGLDTASWFENDLITEPLVSKAGTLNLAPIRIADLNVCNELLTEIPVF